MNQVNLLWNYLKPQIKTKQKNQVYLKELKLKI